MTIIRISSPKDACVVSLEDAASEIARVFKMDETVCSENLTTYGFASAGIADWVVMDGSEPRGGVWTSRLDALKRAVINGQVKDIANIFA